VFLYNFVNDVGQVVVHCLSEETQWPNSPVSPGKPQKVEVLMVEVVAVGGKMSVSQDEVVV